MKAGESCEGEHTAGLKAEESEKDDSLTPSGEKHWRGNVRKQN